MGLVKKVYKNCRLLIMNALSIEKGYINFEQYYINQKSYDSFAKKISSQMTIDAPKYKLKNGPFYQYFYQEHKMDLYEFLKIIEMHIVDRTTLLERINEKLEETVFFIEDSGNFTRQRNYHSRAMINAFISTYANYSFNSIQCKQLLDKIIIEDAKLRMYNIGQGNMSALFLNKKNTPSIIFDMGGNKRCPAAINLLSTNLPSSNSNDFTIVLISHFHRDHINFARHIPNGGYNLHFIIPAYTYNGPNRSVLVQNLIYQAIQNGNSI